MTFIEILGTLALTPLGVLLLYLFAKPIVLKCEDWFYARPEASDGREWIAEYFRTRIWYYFVVTLFLWLTGSGVGSFVANAYEKQHRMIVLEAATRVLEEQPAFGAQAADVETIVRALDIAAEGRKVTNQYAPTVVNLAGAVLLAVLARMSAVLYHPSLMRGILLSMLGISVIVLSLYLMPLGVTGATLQLAPSDPTQAGFLFGAFVLTSTVCGLVADRVLRTADSWGRDAGVVVPYAGYTCIVCGKDAALELPDTDNGIPARYVRLNAACCGSETTHTRSGRFRRKTPGW